MKPWIFAPVAASVIVLAAAPAQPTTDLTLGLQRDTGQTSSVSLRCQPPTGTHPRASAACRTLSTVDGDFNRLPSEAVTCTDIYAPVSATAKGYWRGRPVQYTHTYPNACSAAAESSEVFAF